MARFTRTESDFPRSTREGDRGFRPSFSDWLSRSGLSQEWFGRQSTSIQRALSEAFRNDRSPGEVLETLPAEQRPDTTTESRSFPEPRAVSHPGGGEAFAPPPSMRQSPTPDQIAQGAQAQLGGTEFFDYQPMPFLPDSDRLARSKLDKASQKILDRVLRPEELEAAMSGFREAEVEFYNSETRIGETEAAVGAMGTEGDLVEQAALQIIQSDPSHYLSGDPSEIKTRYDEAREKAREQLESNPSYREAVEKATESFTPFREQDFQLAVQDAIGRQAPFEELGTEMRDAMEGLMGAIAGQVNPQGFVPR